MLNFHIVSLFPEFFESPLAVGQMAKARETGLLSFSFHNPRDFTENRHRQVDDAIYGGGAGMLMQAEPVARAIASIPDPGELVLLTPAGRQLNGELSRELAMENDLTLICGRYEGIDARLGQYARIREIAIGEAILNGGETAALALVESVARFIPGFMGKSASLEEESFSGGMLEYDQFTRPETWRGISVPETLRNGDHKRITEWRRRSALIKTARRRPELLERVSLDARDAEWLRNCQWRQYGRNICFCLVHYPVHLEAGRIGTSSLTNLDVHDIARISRSYGMGPFFVLTPLLDQQELLRKILRHWIEGPDTDRGKALANVVPIGNLEELAARSLEHYGCAPLLLATSAQWPAGKKAPTPLTPAAVLGICGDRPVIILLGTARGLAAEIVSRCDAILRPIRFLNENHLSVRSAAAITADRILGDFH